MRARRLLALEMYVAATRRPALWFRAEDYDPQTGTLPNATAAWADSPRPPGTAVALMHRRAHRAFKRGLVWPPRLADPSPR